MELGLVAFASCMGILVGYVWGRLHQMYQCEQRRHPR